VTGVRRGRWCCCGGGAIRGPRDKLARATISATFFLATLAALEMEEMQLADF
jgi:hypothetical protein